MKNGLEQALGYSCSLYQNMFSLWHQQTVRK